MPTEQELVEIAARAMEPDLFSVDIEVAHRAASPRKIEVAQEEILLKARAALSAILPLIRAEVLEKAAKCAESRHETWKMPHKDDAEPGEVCDDISACADIAAAIRGLK